MIKPFITSAALALGIVLLPHGALAQTDQTTTAPVATATANPMATEPGGTSDSTGSSTTTTTTSGGSSTGWWGLLGLIGLLGLFGARRSNTTIT
jgi:MYXO-CTERM domain-containing protein